MLIINRHRYNFDLLQLIVISLIKFVSIFWRFTKNILLLCLCLLFFLYLLIERQRPFSFCLFCQIFFKFFCHKAWGFFKLRLLLSIQSNIFEFWLYDLKFYAIFLLNLNFTTRQQILYFSFELSLSEMIRPNQHPLLNQRINQVLNSLGFFFF